MGTIKVLAIDLYGTILDTSSIAAVLVQFVPHGKILKIAQDWRKHQLEYSWRLNCMDQYESYFTITRLSLIHALGENSSPLDAQAVEAILATYAHLKHFPDATAFINALPALPHTRALIFSNGDPSTLTATFSKSPIQGLRSMEYISVDAVKRFKPDRKTYEHVVQTQKAHIPNLDPSEVYVVSANPFDVVGAQKAGLGTVWVDREGNGWCDGLGKPQHIVRSLEGILEILKTQVV